MSCNAHSEAATTVRSHSAGLHYDGPTRWMVVLYSPAIYA